MKATTVKEAIESRTASIWHIASVDMIKHNENAIVPLLLTKMITETLDFFNLGKSMNPEQVRQTVELIMNDKLLRNMSIEGFKVCFDLTKKGHYQEKFYDRMDGQIIISNLYAFMREYQDAFEQKMLSEHEKIKAEKPTIHPLIKEKLSALAKEITEKEKPKSLEENKEFLELKAPPKRELSQRDKFIQQCLSDFDTAFSKSKNSNSQGVRLVDYEGLKLDQSEYLTIRVKEYDLEQSKNK